MIQYNQNGYKEMGDQIMDYQQQQSPQEPNEGLTTGLKVVLIIGTIFIQLIGIILGAIWMTDNNNSEEKRKFGKTLLTLGIVVIVVQCICGIVIYGGIIGLGISNMMAF